MITIHHVINKFANLPTYNCFCLGKNYYWYDLFLQLKNNHQGKPEFSRTTLQLSDQDGIECFSVVLGFRYDF